jgi:hypothetical protein
MAEAPWPADVELSAFMAHLPTVQFKVRIPAVVVCLVYDHLADVRAAHPRLAAVSEGEIVASLLARALLDGDDVGKLVGDYRETPAHRLIREATTEEGTFPLPARDTLG